jgi:hypothetical protein
MFRPHQPLPRPDLPPTTIPSPSSPDPCARRLPRPRRGGSAFGSFCPADPIPFRIRTYEKTAHNPFRIRTSKTQDLKPFRIRTYEKPPGGWGGTAIPGCPLPCLYRPHAKVTEHRSRLLCASLRTLRLCVILFRSWPLNFQLSTVDLSPVTSHESPVTASRTSTLPPLIYGIIPPHRGNARIPVHKRGGFGD